METIFIKQRETPCVVCSAPCPDPFWLVFDAGATCSEECAATAEKRLREEEKAGRRRGDVWYG